jgi:cholesterol transport system auxiliary component
MSPTPRPRRALLALAASLAVVQCTSIIPGTGQAPQLYVLARKTTFPSDLPAVGEQLLVGVPSATAEIDTTRIALSRSPTTIDYFANAAWGDRSTLMIQSLLVESFDATGKIIGVARDEGGLRADYLLQPELRRFEAVYGGAGDAPPAAQVRLLVRLVRMPERTIIGQTVGERRVAASRNDMEAIVGAYDDALGGAMKDIVDWTLRRINEDAAAGRGKSPPRS